MGLNRELLSILACPRCRGELECLPRGVMEANDGNTVEGCRGLLCPACQVVYPVTDDIPVMLIEESVPQQKWVEEKEG